MRDAELLSRLLDGELPEDEATALRARLEVEPELAALYATLRGLPSELAELPDRAPPPDLDRALLSGETEAPSGRDWRPWTGWLVAAALLLVVVWPSAEPAARIEVDGRADISVEPAGTLLRGEGAKEEPMQPNTLIAAVGGAALTVAVYEGQARIFQGEDAQPVVVEAISPPPTEARPVITHVQTEAPPPQTLAEAQERIDELEAELARASFEGQLQKGRLMALEGVPQDFPADVDPAFLPAGFQDRLREALKGAEDTEVVQVDCAEFPCLVTLTTDVERDDWDAELKPIAEAMQTQEDDGLHIWASGFQVDEGGPTHNYWTFAVTPAAYGEDEGLRQRTGFRADAVTQELGQMVHDQATEDEEVER